MDYVNEFSEHIRGFKNQSENTIRGYRADILQLLNHTQKQPESVKSEDILHFIGQLDSKPSTKKRKVAAIKMYYKYLKNVQHAVDEDPASTIELATIRAEQSLPKYLTNKEVDRLNRCADSPRDRALITAFLNTGLRISEMVIAKKQHIHEGCLMVNGKNLKERIIPLNKEVLDALKEYHSTRGFKSDYLFLNSKGEPFSKRGMRYVVDNVLVRARLKREGFSVHSLRHTFATNLLSNGATLAEIATLLGHTNIQTTTIYAKVTKPKLIETINRLKYELAETTNKPTNERK